EFPGSGQPCVQAHPRHARRQGLRLDLGQAHEGHWPLCLDDRPPLRGRLRQARPQQGEGRAHHRALPAATPDGGTTDLVLVAEASHHCGMSRRTADAAAVRLPLGDGNIRPTFRPERAALKHGVGPVAGWGEGGRGPLAGPVVAAAVILDPKRIPRGLDDSKKLTPAEREKLYGRICARAEVAVAFGSTARIDRDNILRASLWALA